jgi:NAD(P)-dependent dehydrogenase (short-subunit alcohol dehydrogenase family)
LSFPPLDIPSLGGKIFFITGGTAGFDAQTISLLAAKSPAHIFFSGRNVESADKVVEKVKAPDPTVPVTFIPCDLADLSLVKTYAERFLVQAGRLDVFYANSGVMSLPPGQIRQDHETQFGINHMGHALFIKLLVLLLEKTAAQPDTDVRIIINSSVGYKQAPKDGIVFSTIKSP